MPASSANDSAYVSAYVFCCWGPAGHHFHTPNMRTARAAEQIVPWGLAVERLPPSVGGPQGDAALHHRDGWTALAVVDRTGDSRPGSHTTFCFPSTLTFNLAVLSARRWFPGLFQRFDFEIREVEASLPRRGRER